MLCETPHCLCFPQQPLLDAPKHAHIAGLSGDEYDGDVLVQLSCESVSYPAVHQYRWYRKLNDQSKEVVHSSHQNLTVDPGHPGIYYCSASNGLAGTRSTPVRLFLKSQSTPSVPHAQIRLSSP